MTHSIQGELQRCARRGKGGTLCKRGSVLLLLSMSSANFGADLAPAPWGQLGGDVGSQIRQLRPGQSLVRGNTSLTMIQRDAGVADSDGWYAAKGMGGAVSLRFPAKFYETLTSTKDTDGTLLTVHTLGSVTGEGIKLVLSCYQRSDSLFPSDATSSVVKGLQGLSLGFRSNAFSRHSIDGVEFRGVYANGAHYAGEAFMIPQYFCEFLSEFPKSGHGTVPAAVRRSFDSVRLSR